MACRFIQPAGSTSPTNDWTLIWRPLNVGLFSSCNICDIVKAIRMSIFGSVLSPRKDGVSPACCVCLVIGDIIRTQRTGSSCDCPTTMSGPVKEGILEPQLFFAPEPHFVMETRQIERSRSWRVSEFSSRDPLSWEIRALLYVPAQPRSSFIRKSLSVFCHQNCRKFGFCHCAFMSLICGEGRRAALPPVNWTSRCLVPGAYQVSAKMKAARIAVDARVTTSDESVSSNSPAPSRRQNSCRRAAVLFILPMPCGCDLSIAILPIPMHIHMKRNSASQIPLAGCLMYPAKASSLLHSIQNRMCCCLPDFNHVWDLGFKVMQM